MRCIWPLIVTLTAALLLGHGARAQTPGATASVPINVSTATTAALVAAKSQQSIVVSAFTLSFGGTGNAALVSGTGSACGSGQHNLTGAYVGAASVALSHGDGAGGVLFGPQGNGLCITTTAARRSPAVSPTGNSNMHNPNFAAALTRRLAANAAADGKAGLMREFSKSPEEINRAMWTAIRDRPHEIRGDVLDEIHANPPRSSRFTTFSKTTWRSAPRMPLRPPSRAGTRKKTTSDTQR